MVEIHSWPTDMEMSYLGKFDQHQSLHFHQHWEEETSRFSELTVELWQWLLPVGRHGNEGRRGA